MGQPNRGAAAVDVRGFLSPYRVLDLTDERGLLAGWMFARLGADVVQVEPPGGSPARRARPLDLEGGHSFFWSAYASGKRSIELDLRSIEGRARLHALVAHADVLLESAAPVDRATLGLEPATLAAVNPRLVHVSITPFGAEGPKAGYADSELIVWAASGALFPIRGGDGVPLRFSVPQAYLHGAADAAAGALIALAARRRTGRGQHVDVSSQEGAALCTLSTTLAAAVGHANYQFPTESAGKKKSLDLSGSGARTRKSKWFVQDGLLEMHLGLGPAAGFSANRIFAWMREHDALPAKFHDWDWIKLPARIQAEEISDEDVNEARELAGRFVSQFTKAQLLEVALERGILMAPAQTIADLAGSPHFAERGFFETVQEPAGSRQLPSHFAAGCERAFVPLAPAPDLGADAADVERQWLGDHAQGAASPPVTLEPGAPLAGLKVLDLAWVVAGPLIGRTLADFGATVIRVESSRRIETARLMGPFPGGRMDPQQSALFENCNANKLGLTLDLSQDEGRAIARELARWADVVVESFMPGQMQRFGLDYETLRSINPGLVMVSTALMGQTGPHARMSGFGNVGAALAGFQMLVGRPGERPVGPFGPYTDYVGPRFGLFALLAALDERRRSGLGCYLDVSQAEAGVTFLAPQIADYSATGRIVEAAGNRDPEFVPHGVFRTQGSDAWIAVAVRSDDEWRALAREVGGDALAEDTRYATPDDRRRHEDELEARVAEWCAGQDAHAIETRLQALGVPAHVVAGTDDFVNDPQLHARGHFVRLPHPLMGETVFESARYRLAETPARYERSAPTFGRDCDHVLGEILGYDAARIEDLRSRGVLQ